MPLKARPPSTVGSPLCGPHLRRVHRDCLGEGGGPGLDNRFLLEPPGEGRPLPSAGSPSPAATSLPVTMTGQTDRCLVDSRQQRALRARKRCREALPSPDSGEAS